MLYPILLGILGFWIINLVGSYLVIRAVIFQKPSLVVNPEPDTSWIEHLRIVAGKRSLDTRVRRVATDAPAVIIFHGQGEVVDMWAACQEAFAEAGFSTLVFDYSGFGASSRARGLGDLSRDSLAVLQAAGELLTGGGARYALGFSLGSAVLLQALPMAACRLDGIILCEPFASIRELVCGPGRLPRPLRWLVADLLDSAGTMGRQPRHIHLVHSAADELVPLRHAELLHHRSPDNTTSHRLEGHSHNGIWQQPAGGYVSSVVRIIRGMNQN
jgi:fermentation-respiration switch protein FrsA (DUF1100 family)